YDLAHLGDAADLGHARLGDVDRALFEQVAEVMQARRVLSRGDAGGAGFADAGEPIVILGRPDRLLQPGEIGRAVGALHLHRLRHAPGAVDVVHEGDVGPGAFARRIHGLDAVLVQLDVPEAARHHLAGDAGDGLGCGVAHQARVGAHVVP